MPQLHCETDSLIFYFFTLQKLLVSQRFYGIEPGGFERGI